MEAKKKLIPRNKTNARKWKHEEGAKIHKPFRHRSILDNGWQPTKELKKKRPLIGINNI